jgi:hypothetical protein
MPEWTGAAPEVDPLTSKVKVIIISVSFDELIDPGNVERGAFRAFKNGRHAARGYLRSL